MIIYSIIIEQSKDQILKQIFIQYKDLVLLLKDPGKTIIIIIVFPGSFIVF